MLRRAGPDDAQAIAALTDRAYSRWIAVIGRKPLPMQADYAEALKRHRFDLFERQGQLLGLIETTPENDHLLIVNVAVAPEAQGAGVGGELMRQAERLAVEAGLLGLRLYTNKLYPENIRYYEKRGFHIKREAPLNGGVGVYMAKAIS